VVDGHVLAHLGLQFDTGGGTKSQVLPGRRDVHCRRWPV